MKPFFLFPLLLLAFAPSFPGKQLQTEATLASLGVLRPDRLSGEQVQKDYYLPLPSRVFEAGDSQVQVQVKPSPFLNPGSVVSIWINDRPVDTVRVGKGGLLTLEGPIPGGTRADDPSRNILKLTVKGDLALATGAQTQDPTLDRAATWIDVLPNSTFSCNFAADAPDWLSIGRLAITLQPQVEVVAPANTTPIQIGLALKLASWVAHNSRRSELHFSDATPVAKLSTTDRFLIEPPADGAAPIAIEPDGGNRIIHLRAATPADVQAIWSALTAAERIPLPGREWIPAGNSASAPVQKDGAFLCDLDPGSMALNKGSGDTTCTFHFDLAKLTHASADLTLHLKGSLSPIPDGSEPTGAVFLNGQLIFSETLASGTKSFDWQIALLAARLHGDNEISVAMIPATDSHATYFWQLAPESTLRAAAASKPSAPLGLLDAALRFAQGDSYQVWLAAPSDWMTAAYAAAWLQRVNPSRLLNPELTDTPAAGTPALVVGSLNGKAPGTLSGFPVSIKDGQLSIRSTMDSSQLDLSPAGGLGIWQLGQLGSQTPAILVDGWGPGGPEMAKYVSAQMADSVWVESGDVVIGDSTSPMLTFATREETLPPASELPAATVKANAASPSEPGSSIKVANVNDTWMQYRLWVIGGLWLVLSAIIIWIFEQGRKRASH